MATKYSDTIEEGVARQGWNLLENLIHPLYQMIRFLLFVLVPAICMRLFAEEKRQRTYELLLTSPIRVIEIVLAKYLAASALITIMLVPVAMFPAMAIKYGSGPIDWGPMVTGYFGLFLLGYALASIGVFASSMAENQIVAFVFALAMEMILYLISQASLTMDIIRIGAYELNLGSVLRIYSIADHFQPMLAGLVRMSDVVYFLCLIFFWLWAAKHSVDSARWG